MKRGSALLIVLGMLAFMVVSAIGFSVYMRESRRPSSHLRREATSRYLLKSALANAIARIDGDWNATKGRFEGIHDDVYPGLTRENVVDSDNGNLWKWRVFTPFGCVSPLDTVSTLTLEGLAYLPPAIVNEVRVASRTTQTAHWTNLAYDLGRYAFCAVDVSDCFDVNKVYAVGRRTSAADSRVNLSSLFVDNGSSLETLFDKANGTPFVSVADFNIAAGNTEFTPFYKYIGSSGSRMYSSDDYASVSNALFITDTWFPETNDYLTAELELKSRSSSGVIDLAAEQPFTDWDAASYMHVTDQTKFSSAGGVGMCNLGMVGLACLYDYLDKDSVPISYCLPCTETAPMVCGLGIIFEDMFKLSVNAAKETVEGQHDTGRVDPDTNEPIMEKVTAKKCTLEIPEMRLPIKAVTVYPFKRTGLRKGGAAGNAFTVTAVAKVFFAPADMKCRLDSDSPIFPSRKEDWNAGFKDGVYTILCDSFVATAKPTAKNLPTTDETLGEYRGFLTIAERSLPLYWKVEKTLVNGTGATTEPQNYFSRDAIRNDANRLVTYTKAGVLDETWSSSADKEASNSMPEVDGEGIWSKLPSVGLEDISKDFSTEEYVPHIAVWLRIEQGGEVVDIVPAYPADDVLWGGRDSVVTSDKSLELCGREPPMLEFRGESGFKIGSSMESALSGDTATTFAWTQLYAVDPRYNYAPEDWFAVKGDGDAKKDEWKQFVVDNILGKDGRDRDVFMFTSDQEYLQSIGELQFLPFVQKTDGSANGFTGDFNTKIDYTGESMANRLLQTGTSPDTLSFASKDFFWRTYRAYDRDGGWNDGWCNPFELRDQGGNRVDVIAGRGGFRLNPFSSDPRIRFAAVADTPYDYYIASTNVSINGLALDEDASDRAFCENGTCEKWDEDVIAQVAGRLGDAFYDIGRSGIHDYTEAMYELDWEDGNKGDEQKRIFGLGRDLDDPLHGVDRKFLFSYWRECFQNRQQLFLVFLRAEPLTVGGSMGDSLANSQLGARGVALVWRDPAPPRGASRVRPMSRPDSDEAENILRPHRTRVLFYHQFE